MDQFLVFLIIIGVIILGVKNNGRSKHKVRSRRHIGSSWHSGSDSSWSSSDSSSDSSWSSSDSSSDSSWSSSDSGGSSEGSW